MKHFASIGLLLALVGLGCAGTTRTPSLAASPTPSPTLLPTTTPRPTPSATATASPTSGDALEALLADLQATGIQAERGESFAAEPIATQGLTICVSGDTVQLYAFDTAAQAAARAAMINKDDPSNIGTAIVEWVGNPKFWLREQFIVLYSGSNDDTTSALKSVLGEPFASVEGRPPPPVDTSC